MLKITFVEADSDVQEFLRQMLTVVERQGSNISNAKLPHPVIRVEVVDSVTPTVDSWKFNALQDVS